MRLLLDTHALLRWLGDDGRLGPRARAFIEDPANDVLVSVVSLWEIAAKVRIGKLEVNLREIMESVGREGFSPLDISMPHLLTLVGLPKHYRDPFDHLLIAQAITEDAALASEDRNASKYEVRSVTCSDGSSLGARS